MKTFSRSTFTSLAMIAATSVAVTSRAQDPELSIDLNRVSVAARFGFNISASLLNQAVTPNSPPDYTDGFVLTDISGNAIGKTWNWGYQTADQVADALPGGSIDFHYVAASPRDGTVEDMEADLAAGFEVSYGRQLGLIGIGQDRSMVWGVEVSFGSLDVNLESKNTCTGTATRVTHHYALDGVVPPVAPYSGSYEGPGPLLSSNFSSSSTSVLAATSTQTSRLDALLLGFKLGPFLEAPVYKRLSLQASAGLAVMNAMTELTCRESLVLAGLDEALAQDLKYEHDEWVFGFYGSLLLGYEINDALTLFIGGQYQVLDDVTVSGAGRESTLSLGEDFEVMAGIRATF